MGEFGSVEQVRMGGRERDEGPWGGRGWAKLDECTFVERAHGFVRFECGWEDLGPGLWAEPQITSP